MDIFWWLIIPGSITLSWMSTLFAPSVHAYKKARKNEKLANNTGEPFPSVIE